MAKGPDTTSRPVYFSPKAYIFKGEYICSLPMKTICDTFEKVCNTVCGPVDLATAVAKFSGPVACTVNLYCVPRKPRF